MRWLAIAYAALWIAAAPATAVAGGVAIESHDGPRPDNAGAVLTPVFEALEAHGVRWRPADLGPAYAAASRSRPGVTVDATAFDQLSPLVDLGWNSWAAGDYPSAIKALSQAVDLGLAAPAILARAPHRRSLVRRAMIGLALAHRRLQQPADADRVIAEMIRTFPDEPPTRIDFGSEAIQLHDSARAVLERQPRGGLEIELDTDATVHVNEAWLGRGRSLARRRLIPGVYRVLVTEGTAPGRVYAISVPAGGTARLAVTWSLDRVVSTDDGWAGFRFPSSRARRAGEAAVAARFASALGAPTAIVVGFGAVNGRRAILGSIVDAASGERQVTYYLELDPAPSPARLRELGLALAGAATTVRRIGDRIDPATPPVVTAAAWAGAGVSLAALGAGLIAISRDDRCQPGTVDDRGAPRPVACARVTSTRGVATAALSAGAVVAIGSGWLFARTAPPRPAVRDLRWVIGGTSAALVMGGIGLMAADESRYRTVDDGTSGQRPSYRPTLLAGGAVAAIGALGLGATAYLFAGSGETRAMIDASAGRASIGVAGRF